MTDLSKATDPGIAKVVSPREILAAGGQFQWLANPDRISALYKGEIFIGAASQSIPLQKIAVDRNGIARQRGDHEGSLYFLSRNGQGVRNALLSRCRVEQLEALSCDVLVEAQHPISEYAVSGDGRLLAYVGLDGDAQPSSCVFLLRTSTGRASCVYRGVSELTVVSLSPDGGYLAATVAGLRTNGSDEIRTSLSFFKLPH